MPNQFATCRCNKNLLREREFLVHKIGELTEEQLLACLNRWLKK